MISERILRGLWEAAGPQFSRRPLGQAPFGKGVLTGGPSGQTKSRLERFALDKGPGRRYVSCEIPVGINTDDIIARQTQSSRQQERGLRNGPFWPVSGNEDMEQLRCLAKQLLVKALAAALADGRRMTGGDDAGPASAEHQHKAFLLERWDNVQWASRK